MNEPPIKEGDRVEVSLYNGKHPRYGPQKFHATVITVKDYPTRYRVLLDQEGPTLGERDIYVRHEQVRRLVELESIADAIFHD